jgi:hypothetical protein
MCTGIAFYRERHKYCDKHSYEAGALEMVELEKICIY